MSFRDTFRDLKDSLLGRKKKNRLSETGPPTLSNWRLPEQQDLDPLHWYNSGTTSVHLANTQGSSQLDDTARLDFAQKLLSPRDVSHRHSAVNARRPPNISASSGMSAFENAHDFIIGTAYMNDNPPHRTLPHARTRPSLSEGLLLPEQYDLYRENRGSWADSRFRIPQATKRLDVGKPLPAIPPSRNNSADKDSPEPQKMEEATSPSLLHLPVHHGLSHSTPSINSANAQGDPRPVPQQDVSPRYPRATNSTNMINLNNLSGSPAFPGAHSFSIGTFNMSAQINEHEAETLKLIVSKGMASAMLDSAERSDAPRCNLDTRQLLRARIVVWGKSRDSQRVFWLSGPAGVGKSAVAQTVAEEVNEEGLLGATFFFSRPNHRRDPDTVIPTLVYQLAIHIPQYLTMIVEKLAKDPAVLDRNRRRQFKDLIADPFNILIAEHSNTIQQALLIVLDGLDECDGHGAQREFVEMVSSHARTVKHSPLRWLICTRPEPHLKTAFSSETCKVVCIKEELEVDDAEAVKDAVRLFREGFSKIRNDYQDQLPAIWPTSDQLRDLAKSASGHLGYVSFVIRFIGDEFYGNPAEQLNLCLRCFTRSGTVPAGDVHPLHALDLIYTQILCDIPPKILPTTQLILGLYILYGHTSLTAMVLANFLGLDQASFYQALRQLHSVLYIPPAFKAYFQSIRMHHASFSDYLRDPTRSHQFALDEGVVHREAAILGLGWMSHYPATPSDKILLPGFTWLPPSHLSRLTNHRTLFEFSTTSCWKACPQVPINSLETLLDLLEKFDFHLEYSKWETRARDFASFIRWLFLLGTRRNNSIVSVLTKPPAKSIGINLNSEDSAVLAECLTLGPAYGRGRPCRVHLQVGKFNPTLFTLDLNAVHASTFL